MTTQTKMRRQTGDQLVREAEAVWNDFSEAPINPAHKSELSQILGELSGRIQYVCSGQLPPVGKYSSLDGRALAQHTRSTVQTIGEDLPVEVFSELQSTVHEMANRVQTCAGGTPNIVSAGHYRPRKNNSSENEDFAAAVHPQFT